MNVLVLLGSARRGRRGEAVANWAVKHFNETEGLDAELVDLAALQLPFYDEPLQPYEIKDNAYENPRGADWSRRVSAADGFVFLVAEYNHSYTPLLKNAIDWLYQGWIDKPVAFISYSNGSIAGARAVEAIKPVTIHVGLRPLGNNLHLPKIDGFFNEHGEPHEEYFTKQLGVIAADLLKHHDLFKSLRNS